MLLGLYFAIGLTDLTRYARMGLTYENRNFKSSKNRQKGTKDDS